MLEKKQGQLSKKKEGNVSSDYLSNARVKKNLGRGEVVRRELKSEEDSISIEEQKAEALMAMPSSNQYLDGFIRI